MFIFFSLKTTWIIIDEYLNKFSILNHLIQSLLNWLDLRVRPTQSEASHSSNERTSLPLVAGPFSETVFDCEACATRVLVVAAQSLRASTGLLSAGLDCQCLDFLDKSNFYIKMS